MTTNIYVGQSELRITLTANVDITDALDLQIRYKKPSGAVGHWTATEQTAATGVIYYDLIDENDLDESGTWTFWPYVTFADGRSAPGDPATQVVTAEPGIEVKEIGIAMEPTEIIIRDGKTAISNAIVSVKSGDQLIDTKKSDRKGKAVFDLQPGTYLVWAERGGKFYRDGDELVV